ncbi:hypothetical protein BG000_009270 [Podila horticola]|nr:hypothetical protein BG000_009270 [Podila horticola]
MSTLAPGAEKGRVEARLSDCEELLDIFLKERLDGIALQAGALWQEEGLRGLEPLLSVTHTIPLQEQHNTDLVTKLSITDLKNLLKHTPKRRSPGKDGLPFEIYPLILSNNTNCDLFINVTNDTLTQQQQSAQNTAEERQQPVAPQQDHQQEDQEQDQETHPSASATLSVHAFSLDTTWPVPRILAQTVWFPFAHGIIYNIDATRKNDPRGIDHLLNASQFLASLVSDPHFKRRDIPVVVLANKAGLDPETCYRVDEIAEILGCEEWDHPVVAGDNGAVVATRRGVSRAPEPTAPGKGCASRWSGSRTGWAKCGNRE